MATRKIARAMATLFSSVSVLQQLIAAAPSSLLFEAAMLRLTESLFESGDFAAAATSAKPLTLSKNVAIAREGSALMGLAYLRAGKTTEARDVFTKLVMQMPDASRPDDYALEAVRQLDALEKELAAKFEADLLLRASVYQFNRDHGARVHYQAVIVGFRRAQRFPTRVPDCAWAA